MSPDDAARQAYASAIRYLSNRDHCAAELIRKLERKGHDPGIIRSTIEELLAAGYVNEQRYAIDYVEQRLQRGRGPLAIRSRLQERGVDPAIVQSALDSVSISWWEHAKSVIVQHYDAQQILSRDRKNESHIARFLQHRGFSGSDSLRALQAARRQLLKDRKVTLDD